MLFTSYFSLKRQLQTALEAKFDDFCTGSVFRKLTYPIGHRQLAKNPNPVQKAQIWIPNEFAIASEYKDFALKEQMDFVRSQEWVSCRCFFSFT